MATRATAYDNSLTQRYETFCRSYAEHGVALQALRECMEVSHWTYGTQRTEASRILHLPEVQARIAELRQEMRSETIADLYERREILTAIARDRVETGAQPYASDRIRSIDTLNRMDNVYVERTESVNATKIQVEIVRRDIQPSIDADASVVKQITQGTEADEQ